MHTGTLHGGLKPSQVLLTAAGDVRLSFGLASKVAAERDAAGLDRPGAAACANGPYWAGPPRSAPRCRPRAVGPTLTVWCFFLLLLHFGKSRFFCC